MYFRDFFVLLALLVLLPGIALAQSTDEADTSPYSQAELISEFDHVVPGSPFTLALKMEMDPGWHSYWQNPGDSGEPTEIEWELPANFSSSPIQWPYPQRIDLPPLRTYGYSDEVLLLTEITPSSDLEVGTELHIQAMAYWLICEEICLPAEEAVSITLPVRPENPSANEHKEAFETVRSQLPKTLDDWAFEASSYAGSYVLQVTPPSGNTIDFNGAYFFASGYEVIDHPSAQPITQEGDTYLIALQQSEYATGPVEQLEGVLVAPEEGSWDEQIYVPALAINVAVNTDVLATSSQESSTSVSLVWMLVLAFAGGLLLNLMPCVFPILSIKVLGFAKQGDQAPSAIRKQGYAFGMGVLVSFWLLASLFLILRTAGNQIGWGFQLQSPLFVAGMALLFFGIGLNLLGVFEVGFGMTRIGAMNQTGESGNHVRRSFFDGVLATLVATPCTAPFMGAALGAAIVVPPAQALLIFTFLGLGMAIPYMVLSMTPALVKMLPKPGPWMEVLKQVLAFPMLATTLWLVWVFGRQTGVDGLALLLMGMLLLGLSLWIVGRWPGIQISSRVRLITRSIAVIALGLSLGAVYMGTSSQADLSTPSETTSNWLPFSTEQVAQLRAEGQPVFIDFTAAWCLTCQVNKKTTLNNKAVQDAFATKGVTLFQADWTNQDIEITQALEEHGRSGVPLYVLYPGSSAPPVLLPEILTENIVLEALDALPDRALALSND